MSVLHSIRATLVPIRREGFPFIAIALVVAVAGLFLWQPLFWVAAIVAAWCAYFFRDPARVTPVDPDLVISPADGRVSAIVLGTPPAELGLGAEPRRRISVFMNVFDCHVNRAPVAGSIGRIAYRPGKFINAELDKASEHNERNGLVIDTVHGPVGVVQIAGLVARRILCFVKEGDAPWEDETYIFIAVSRTPGHDLRPRLVAPPRRAHGRIELKLCQPNGAVIEDLVTRREGERFKRARRADWGDAF